MTISRSSASVNHNGGSQTQLHTSSPTIDRPDQPVLRLRGALPGGLSSQNMMSAQGGGGERMVNAPGDTAKRITWADDVVDNEGMGKKKSKVCCIYHAPRPMDESSDEDSSSNSDESGNNDGAARPARLSKKKEDCNHDHNTGCGRGKAKGRNRSPNAYERQPKHKPKSG